METNAEVLRAEIESEKEDLLLLQEALKDLANEVVKGESQ
jgi:hypothetical protein